MRSGVDVLIDYFTFTVKEADSPQQVIRDWLGMDVALFQDGEYSVLRGYSRMMWFANIYVAYSGRDQVDKQTGHLVFDGQKMGVCVSMSGNGCRTFERFSSRAHDADSAFPSLFADIAANDSVNVSRCDVACDDTSGFLDLEDVRDRVEHEGVNSRLRKRAVYLNYANNEYEGVGIYIGSEKSDFRIRFYDKALEQGVDGHWVRCELVFRHEESLGFVQTLVQSAVAVGELAAQVLNDKCAFIYRDDVNITRCTVCEWWAAFVDTVKSVALVSRKRVQRPVERVAEWFRHSCGPSVTMLARTLGFGWFAAVARDSADRLGPKREALIRDFNALRRESAVPTFSPAEPVTPAISDYQSYDMGEAYHFAGRSQRWEQIPIPV